MNATIHSIRNRLNGAAVVVVSIALFMRDFATPESAAGNAPADTASTGNFAVLSPGQTKSTI